MEEQNTTIDTKENIEGQAVRADIDWHDEMIQIEMLFQSRIISFGYKEYSLETYADKNFFPEWKSNEDCQDTDEMRAGLNIDGILRSADPSEGEVLTYVQYVLNIAEMCRRAFNKAAAEGYDFDIRNYTQLLSRIRDLLNRFHYDTKYVADKEFIFIVPKDTAAQTVIEEAPEPLAAALTEYRSTSAVGRLDRKRELLVELGQQMESFPDNLKPENGRLYSRIEFLLNHVRIREDDGDGETEIRRIADMDARELEEWYDETYQLLLLRIMQMENRERLDRVDELADECGIGISQVTEEELDRIIRGVPDAEPPKESSAVMEEEEDEEIPRAQTPASHTIRNVVIALVVADIIFIVMLLLYFNVF